MQKAMSQTSVMTRAASILMLGGSVSGALSVVSCASHNQGGGLQTSNTASSTSDPSSVGDASTQDQASLPMDEPAPTAPSPLPGYGAEYCADDPAEVLVVDIDMSELEIVGDALYYSWLYEASGSTYGGLATVPLNGDSGAVLLELNVATFNPKAAGTSLYWLTRPELITGVDETYEDWNLERVDFEPLRREVLIEGNLARFESNGSELVFQEASPQRLVRYDPVDGTRQTLCPTQGLFDLAISDSLAVWAEYDSIHVCSFTQPEDVEIAPGETKSPQRIAIDNDFVYWVDYSSGVYRASLDGSGSAEVLVEGLMTMEVIVDERLAYFATRDSVFSVPKSGGEPTLLAQAPAGARQLTLHEGALYYIEVAGQYRCLRRVAL